MTVVTNLRRQIFFERFFWRLSKFRKLCEAAAGDELNAQSTLQLRRDKLFRPPVYED